MNSLSTQSLRVPGATLVYEVRGSGPLLLMISGGGNGSQFYEAVVPYLVDQYTVVTYDRRGLSLSQLDDPQEEQRVEVHSDDAHRLLAELGCEYEPALVFGSSGGAIISLDLVARHADQIARLIAHEPPTHLVPENDPIQEVSGVREVYRQAGLGPAFQHLLSLNGMVAVSENRESDLRMNINQQHAARDMQFLFEHEFSMYDRYRLDFPALLKATDQTRIILAGGSGQADAGYQSARAVAEELGTDLVEFPGRHTGYVSNPRAFAQRLKEVLQAE